MKMWLPLRLDVSYCGSEIWVQEPGAIGILAEIDKNKLY